VSKKLYSFRADTTLLDGLRVLADRRRVTVTEIMHEILYEGLRLAGINAQEDARSPKEFDTELSSKSLEALHVSSYKHSPDLIEQLRADTEAMKVQIEELKSQIEKS